MLIIVEKQLVINLFLKNPFLCLYVPAVDRAAVCPCLEVVHARDAGGAGGVIAADQVERAVAVGVAVALAKDAGAARAAAAVGAEARLA